MQAVTMNTCRAIAAGALFSGAMVMSGSVMALPGDSCADLPDHGALQAELTAARNNSNGGFNLDMWGVIVNRDGVVCAVAFTGGDRGDQWPGSRVIAGQKANTANAFSLPGLALSTGNLFSAVQPGGSLFGLQHSNPVDTTVAYGGSNADIGSANDPMVGAKIGGVNVFGGGLALYDNQDGLLGAIGVSGDTSCADHNIAWRTRHGLVLDFVPGGVNTEGQKIDDNIIYDIAPDENGHATSGGGFGHPDCGFGGPAISLTLPVIRGSGG